MPLQSPRIRPLIGKSRRHSLLTFFADNGAVAVETIFAWNYLPLPPDRRSVPPPVHLRCLRTTSFNPDQISVTAQTFTSTRSVWSARSRTMSSVTSVAMSDDFLYHEPQIAPAVVMV